MKKLFSKGKKKNEGNEITTVLTNSAAFGVIPQRDYFDKDIANSDNTDGYFVVQPDDYIYNPRISELAPYGPFNKNETGMVGIVSPLYTVLTSKTTKMDPKYLQYFFASAQWHKYAYSVANYGARFDRMNITDDDFFSLPIVTPPLPEQQKIAEILATCDKVIELKQKLIEEKRRQKKWLMEKLLSENNKAEERTLSSLCSFICDGDWIESKDQSESGIRLIQTGNVGVGQYLDKYGRARFISEETFTRLNCTDVFAGDVLISRLPDPIGRACMVPQLPTRAITAVDCTIIRFKSKDIAQFFLQFATSQQYFNKVAILAGGSTRTRISRKEIENLLIPIPSDPMAMKSTTEVLSLMDKDIASLEAELSEWQQKKKALMQLLLTGLVRVKI